MKSLIKSQKFLLPLPDLLPDLTLVKVSFFNILFPLNRRYTCIFRVYILKSGMIIYRQLYVHVCIYKYIYYFVFLSHFIIWIHFLVYIYLEIAISVSVNTSHLHFTSKLGYANINHLTISLIHCYIKYPCVYTFIYCFFYIF